MALRASSYHVCLFLCCVICRQTCRAIQVAGLSDMSTTKFVVSASADCEQIVLFFFSLKLNAWCIVFLIRNTTVLTQIPIYGVSIVSVVLGHTGRPWLSVSLISLAFSCCLLITNISTSLIVSHRAFCCLMICHVSRPLNATLLSIAK